jgi:glycerol uptake facilitator-like aquaporin
MNLTNRLMAEFIGTSGLLMVVVGSGIMGESLSGGNVALALLANSIATGCGLYALIQSFNAISGAHFNPAVSLVERLCGRLSTKEFLFYSTVQVLGGIAGVFLAHSMFGQNLLQFSTHDRGEFRFLISEGIATFGLISVISLSSKKNSATAPLAIAFFITSAYWFTSSTSFANPAVTIARSLTNTFSGIHWTSVGGFIAVQIVGAIIAFRINRRFLV